MTKIVNRLCNRLSFVLYVFVFTPASDWRKYDSWGCRGANVPTTPMSIPWKSCRRWR